MKAGIKELQGVPSELSNSLHPLPYCLPCLTCLTSLPGHHHWQLVHCPCAKQLPAIDLQERVRVDTLHSLYTFHASSANHHVVTQLLSSHTHLLPHTAPPSTFAQHASNFCTPRYH
jgi:hypothetical protein